jgi:hypothetical protein
MGKTKIAETLARAGLHLGTTTVGRMRKQAPSHGPEESRGKARGATDRVSVAKRRMVTAKRPNHVWHIRSCLRLKTH